MLNTLIIEDDPHIADVVDFLLREQQHRVDRATDGRQGWQLFQRQSYHLVILDLGLPGIPGLELFKNMRERKPDQPIIMLTARGHEPDRVKGLNLGADDYITKPFSNPELVARVHNLLRRCPPPVHTLSHESLILYPDREEVTADGRPFPLPAHEFRLLQTLMKQPGRLYSRDQLIQHMYAPGSDISDRAVDQAVARLRRKLRSVLMGGDPIEAVYGRGYRLLTEEERS
ncbi:MAG: response regulator transcription factor [Kiritimatiellae bacterium]|jgi:DNA-binding response OmpR family regulator|nr:response regulator transcription factor [Kiritimatiellia bacterium]